MNEIVFAPRSYKTFVTRILQDGVPVEVRDEVWTREVMNAHIVIHNPLDRLILDSGRKMNVGFAIAEWSGLMNGENSVAFYNRFISNYGKFSSDSEVIVGAYGPRVAGFDQINGVINRLKDEEKSRQAVISIYDGKSDLNADGRDVPCTLSLQFLIRNGALNLIVNMRSSDVIWGLTYDIFQFTMLQEYVAQQVHARLGEFFLNAGSMHIYDAHHHIVGRLLGDRYPVVMDPMPNDVWEEDLEILHDDLWTVSTSTIPAFRSTGYFLQMVNAAACQNAVLTKNPRAARHFYEQQTSPVFRRALRPWLLDLGIM